MDKSFSLLLVILFSWGLWGFFGKIATQKIGHQVLFWNGLTSYILILAYLWWTKQLTPIRQDTNAIAFAVLSGISISVGSFAYYFLLRQAGAGKVVTLTALYPMITLILSVIFLGEQMTLTKGLGIMLALVAVYMLNL